jgi:hypothetical protein
MVQANIDWSSSEISLLWKNQKIKVPVECRKLLTQPLKVHRPVVLEEIKETAPEIIKTRKPEQINNEESESS